MTFASFLSFLLGVLLGVAMTLGWLYHETINDTFGDPT